MYIILIRPERNVRGNLMPSKWRSGRNGRGAAPGAVCAALVGAAPLPRPAGTPSTDLSTLDATGTMLAGTNILKLTHKSHLQKSLFCLII